MLEIIKVNKFSVDGKEFNSESEARQYAIEHEALGDLRKMLKDTISSSLTRQGNIDNVLKHILDQSAEVSRVLSTYRRRQPKKKVTGKTMEKVAA